MSKIPIPTHATACIGKTKSQSLSAVAAGIGAAAGVDASATIASGIGAAAGVDASATIAAAGIGAAIGAAGVDASATIAAGIGAAVSAAGTWWATSVWRFTKKMEMQ